MCCVTDAIPGVASAHYAANHRGFGMTHIMS
jgi:hypothetical protein